MHAFDARDGRPPVVGVAENEQHKNDGVPQRRDQLAFGIWLQIGFDGRGGHFCVGERVRVQNISVWLLATRELLCANPEGYGTVDACGGAFSGRMSRAPGYTSGLDISTKWQGGLDLISSGKGSVPVSTYPRRR